MDQMLKKTKYKTGIEELDEAVDGLIDMLDNPSQDDYLIREKIITVLKMRLEKDTTLELKIANAALKEMRYAFKVFREYEHIRKVTVFGSSRTKEETDGYRLARDFTRKIADLGYMVITGAGGGIMQAANEGAGRERSFGLNIKLPFEQEANRFIEGDKKLITFKYFFTRKLMFIKEADAVVLFPGGYGTLNECMELLALVQTGKSWLVPIVLIEVPGRTYWKNFMEFISINLRDPGYTSPDDLNFVYLTDNADDACSHILHFYKNYHSTRVIGDHMVLRLTIKPEISFLDQINRDYSDMLREGTFTLREHFPEETDEEEIIHLQRLSFCFNGKSFGRLRKLIDAINDTNGEAIHIEKAEPINRKERI